MSAKPLTGLVQSASSLARGISVRSSALNPLLWLTAATLPTSLGFAYLFREHPVVMSVLVVLGAGSGGLSWLALIYFALKDPTRLQSEAFQRWREWFQATQGRSGPIPIEPGTQPPIRNPQLPALPADNPDEI